MTDPLQILIGDVWLRVGPRHWSGGFRLDQFSKKIPSDEIILVFRWPARLSYLKIGIRSRSEAARGGPGGTSGSGAESEFVLGSRAEELLRTYGVKKIQLEPSGEELRAAVLDREAKVLFDVEIDTDHPGFKQDAENSGDESLTCAIKYLAIGCLSRGGNTGSARFEQGTISVVMTPAKRMPRDDGYLAIDLGNTSSTLVRIELGHTHVQDVRVIEFGHEGERTETIPSALRIVGFEAATNPKWFDQADCLIGAEAKDHERAGDGWLVLGAKRLLTGPDNAPPERGWIGGRRFAVERTLPAELLLRGLFRSVHQAKALVPRRIAVTCPTTFSFREIQRLKRAVVQGWRRSLEATLREFDASKIANPDIPQVVLDEAAAAAFFFIYRDFIDGPGGLLAFRYLYPRGLNLLVYDCGGGTTDIALVHAQVESENYDQEATPAVRLMIRVLGRTGQRSFGGDNITVAAFRILKAKIACRINKRELAAFRAPEVDGFAQFIDRYKVEIDFNVPTTFARENLPLSEHRLRMAATYELWKLAEQFKIELGSRQSVRGAEPLVMPGLALLISNHHGITVEMAASYLRDLTLERGELDAMIAGALDESIEMANKMIGSRLEDDEVHRVHLVGNASRYPAVEESIKRKLRVRFLDHRLRVEEAERKTSVAKGAALALAIRNSFVGADVEFDGEHVDRLPFDITYDDLTYGGPRILFHENQRYEDLVRVAIHVPDPRRKPLEERSKRVILRRRWPGEDSGTPFLVFDFVKPIQGPLWVSYDPARHGFYMQDSRDPGGEVPGIELHSASNNSPIESGEL
jgi:molecular chaperone DnaK (HSP70)